MTEMGEFGKWIALGGAMMVTVATVIRPIGMALARRISGAGAPDPTTGLTTGGR